MAKALVKQRNAVNRIYQAKANIQQVGYEITNMSAQLKMTQVIGKSAAVMHSCNELLKVGNVSDAVKSMMKEMAKAEMIGEITDDMFSMMDGDEVEDAADEEVQKVFDEILLSATGDVSAAPTGKIEAPVKEAAAADAAAAEAEAGEQEDEELAAMQKRLAALS